MENRFNRSNDAYSATRRTSEMSKILKENIDEIMKELSELKRKKEILQKNADNQLISSMSQKGESGNKYRISGNMSAYKKESEKLKKEEDFLNKRLNIAKIKLTNIESKENRFNQNLYRENSDFEKENGHMSVIINKYTNEDIDDAKMKIFEACRTGLITESMKNELMEDLDDAVVEYNTILESAEFEEIDPEPEDNETVEESVDDPMDAETAKLIIYEACRRGDITEEEKDNLIADL